MPYREMRRHIHEILNANIENETEQKNVEKVRIELKDVENVTAGPRGNKATIQPGDKKNIIIQWKKALLTDLNFVGIVVRL